MRFDTHADLIARGYVCIYASIAVFGHRCYKMAGWVKAEETKFWIDAMRSGAVGYQSSNYGESDFIVMPCFAGDRVWFEGRVL